MSSAAVPPGSRDRRTRPADACGSSRAASGCARSSAASRSSTPPTCAWCGSVRNTPPTTSPSPTCAPTCCARPARPATRRAAATPCCTTSQSASTSRRLPRTATSTRRSRRSASWSAFTWGAMDHWFEEDEEVHVHPRNPYTRVDMLPSSRSSASRSTAWSWPSRTIRPCCSRPGCPRATTSRSPPCASTCSCRPTASIAVSLQGNRPVLVGGDRRAPVHADYAWAYDYPLPESIRIAGLICFYNERVDLYRRRRAPGAPQDRVLLTSRIPMKTPPGVPGSRPR